MTLVLGGARSGKSEVAERMAAGSGRPVTYIATYAAGTGTADPDMETRIERHRRRRPPGWSTVELGTPQGGADLVAALDAVGGTALVDSLGTWVAGHEAFAVDAGALCAALARRAGPTVVVSEEVGLGVHPATESGRLFRDALGALNTAVAAVADSVLLVVAGRVLPMDPAP